MQATYYVGEFGDARLNKGGSLLFERMLELKTVILRQLGGNRATEVKFGRWLKNKKVELPELIKHPLEKTALQVEGLHVLAIHDTSEINYQAHAKRTSGLGTVGNGTDKGLFLHPMLSFDTETGDCLGLSGLKVWVRDQDNEIPYQKRPIEEKESYKWLEVAKQTKETLDKAAMVTIVADRESDIYEEWARIPDEKTHLLTRVCRDRALEGSGKLYAHIDELSVSGCYEVEVPARPGKRTAHVAKLVIRFDRVTIKRPQKCKDKTLPKTLELTVVDVRELPESVVGDEEPIHWRLFTTHSVENFIEAMQIVDWYRLRWQVEQFFRILKKQGLDVEASQLEHADSLMKLIVLAVQVAITTLQLLTARSLEATQPITRVFTPEEIVLLTVLLKQLEGRTEKQKNPFKPEQLGFATWIIARLGGWKGYGSESPPGPITIHRGLREFASIYRGWHLQFEICA